tara:strand:- start:880 stop:1506 length:627 start_codon:yes stop_codon:yes gene_type:complete
MKELYNIFKWIHKKETEADYREKNGDIFNKRLLELQPGKSFKGHAATVCISNTDIHKGVDVTIHQRYFNTNTTQSYYPQDNLTERSFSTFSRNTQWMNKIYNLLLNETIKMYNICQYQKGCYYKWKFDKYEIDFDEYGIYMSNKCTVKGLGLLNHKENINEIKEMNNILSRFKSYLKNVNLLDILTNISRESDDDHMRDVFIVKKFSF